MTVEFLYWEGCPSHDEARELLDEVLRQRGLDVDVETRHVATREEAAELRFPGSPTIRSTDATWIRPARRSLPR